jgi:hypothetical protein
MHDGRYLIFYTFDDNKRAQGATDVEENKQGSAAKSEPQAKPEAEEERGV